MSDTYLAVYGTKASWSESRHHSKEQKYFGIFKDYVNEKKQQRAQQKASLGRPKRGNFKNMAKDCSPPWDSCRKST